MRFLIFFAYSLSLVACTSVQSNSTSEQNIDGNSWKFSYELRDGKVFFEFVNTTNSALVVSRPLEKHIAVQQEDGSWKRLNIPYCPCNAMCPNPPEFITVAAGQKHSFYWDFMTEKCVGGQSKKEEVDAEEFKVVLNFRQDKKVEKAEFLVKMSAENIH